jgi:hypothetical protein
MIVIFGRAAVAPPAGANITISSLLCILDGRGQVGLDVGPFCRWPPAFPRDGAAASESASLRGGAGGRPGPSPATVEICVILTIGNCDQ